MSVEPLIEVRNLSVRQQGFSILRDINMDVFPGELHSIIGPNGAGKTTLIRSLLGGMPHTGQIRFHDRSSGVTGYVPQHLEFGHAGPMTVGDFLSLLVQKRALPLGKSRSTKKRITELLSLTEADHLVGRNIGSLSGGELQRVLLAQALYPKPEILLLDEPASHVDEKGARQFEELLYKMCRDEGITVLMVAHHISTVLRISDAVSVLNRDLVFTGNPWEFAASDACYRLFGYRGTRVTGSGSEEFSDLAITGYVGC